MTAALPFCVALFGLCLLRASAQLDPAALEQFNFSCPVPMQENTNLSDTTVGEQFLSTFFEAIGNADGWDKLAAKVCEDQCKQGAAQCSTCKIGAKAALASTATKKCGNFSHTDIVNFCRLVKPGEFCAVLRDKSQVSNRCVLMEGDSDRAYVLDCPLGFYCRGANLEPRVCRKGYFCPVKTSVPLGCPPGSICPVASVKIACRVNRSESWTRLFGGTNCTPDFNNRTIMPTPCQGGYICKNGTAQQCPAGYYCVEGAASPVKCERITERCPAGTGKPDRTLKSLAFVAVFLGIIFSLVCTLKFWCLPHDRWWARVLVAASFLALLWLSEFMRHDPMYTALATLTILFCCVSWGSLVSPSIVKCASPKFGDSISFAVDGTFILAVALLIGYVSKDMQTSYFLFTFIPGTLLMRVCLIDEGYSTTLKLCMMAIGFTAAFLILAAVSHKRRWILVVYPSAAAILAIDFLVRLALDCRGETEHQHASMEVPLREDDRAPPSSSMEDGMVPLPSVVPFGEGAWPSPAQGFGVDSTDITCATAAPTGISLEFKKVSLLLPNGQTILDNISLSVPAGCSVAIMGPSGCGKSSITNVLSGRASYGIVKGDILINGGREHSIRELCSITGFVPQDDVMHRNLSVREVAGFQAELRMPFDVNYNRREGGGGRGQAVDELVDDVLDRLGLGDPDLQATLIGDEDARGVSGGQRKRVSIAMELVAKPHLLFLDEPTSGLDSTTSHSVVEMLTKTARDKHCTTMAVIHQPRYQTLLLFDRVIILAAGGYLVYSGPSVHTKQYFVDFLGMRLPDDANPADIFMDAITLDSAPSVMDSEKVDMTNKHAFGKSLAKIWREKGCKSDYAQVEVERLPLPRLDREACTWGGQIIVQMKRALLQLQRDWSAVAMNNLLLVAGLLCLCFGSPPTKPADQLMHPCLALFLLMLTQGVASQRAFGGVNRPVGWRESAASVNTALYFVGRDMSSLIEMLSGALIFTGVYWAFGPLLLNQHAMLWVSFAFIYAIWGLNYIWSVLLNASSAQMMAVVSSFLAFLFVGVQPQFVNLLHVGGGIGPYLMVASPVRWAYGQLMCGHMVQKSSSFSNALVQFGVGSRLNELGMPMQWLTDEPYEDRLLCAHLKHLSIQERWTGDPAAGRPPISFVCSTKQLFLLGTFYRVVAMLALLFTSKARARGGGRFIDAAEQDNHPGPWGHLARNAFKLFFVVFTHLQMVLLILTH